MLLFYFNYDTCLVCLPSKSWLKGLHSNFYAICTLLASLNLMAVSCLRNYQQQGDVLLALFYSSHAFFTNSSVRLTTFLVAFLLHHFYLGLFVCYIETFRLFFILCKHPFTPFVNIVLFLDHSNYGPPWKYTCNTEQRILETLVSSYLILTLFFNMLWHFAQTYYLLSCLEILLEFIIVR